jgi:TRAP-type uncharacterized transport system substrate-binding protein
LILPLCNDRVQGGNKNMTITILRRSAAALAVLALTGGAAAAQTYGFATLPPGTLNHTTASAISKVVKEKGGTNMLVQPTAGDNVINPLVGRGEVEIGITNIMEIQDALDGGLKDMRIITAVHALRTPLFVRKDSGMFKNADLKGKRVTMGYSAMRNIDKTMRAMLASAGLTDTQRGAQRRRVHGRQRRHVFVRLRRPKGERGRRHRRRYPRA